MDRPFAAYTGEEPYVFVSYSHKNSSIVFPCVKCATVMPSQFRSGKISVQTLLKSNAVARFQNLCCKTTTLAVFEEHRDVAPNLKSANQLDYFAAELKETGTRIASHGF